MMKLSKRQRLINAFNARKKDRTDMLQDTSEQTFSTQVLLTQIIFEAMNESGPQTVFDLPDYEGHYEHQQAHRMTTPIHTFYNHLVCNYSTAFNTKNGYEARIRKTEGRDLKLYEKENLLMDVVREAAIIRLSCMVS